MKPLEEEKIIDDLFEKLQALGLRVPDTVIFYDDHKTMGKANKRIIYISSNHIGKDLVETVVHEIVHYNGYMHHKPSFYMKYQEVLDAIQS